MKKRTVLFFVFDGFAHWEAAHALVGIQKSNVYQVKTIALKRDPIISMGGLTVFPDLDFFPEVDLSDMDRTTTAMLILPGGEMWERCKQDSLPLLIQHCVQKQIPVAAICGGTLALANAGVLNEIHHTSNGITYLKALSQGYTGDEFYDTASCVCANNLITASSSGSIAFAMAIVEMLEIKHHEELAEEFSYFEKKEATAPV